MKKNRALGTLLGLVLLVGPTTACEITCTEGEQKQGGVCVAKSLKRFTGQPVTEQVDWSPGASLTIDGVRGDISLSQGTSDQVVVTFEPFSYRAYDADDAATAEIENNLVFDVQGGSSVTITSARNGGTTGLGTHIRVSLPVGFDGDISVRNRGDGSINPGDLQIDAVGLSPSVTLLNEKVGRCRLKGAATVTRTTVTCKGEIEVLDVSNDVNVTHTFGTELNTAILLRLASVSAGAVGGKIESKDGDIVLVLPSAGDYAVQAVANSSSSNTTAVVDFGAPPATCSVNAASDASQTLSCGAANVVYQVTAGLDGVGASNVFASYQ